jgi:heptosyltransferase II
MSRADVTAQPAHDGPVLILQPLPGVGDMVWHLSAIHAIAAAHPERERILLAKHRSRADELFLADPAITRVIWVDRAEKHKGPGGFRALVEDLRQEEVARSYQLHHSARYAAALAAAGVPERFGYGTTLVTRMLTQPPHLGSALRREHPVELANRFTQACGFTLPDHADRLRVAPELANRMHQRLSGLSKPVIALGLGSSEAFKQWGAENFASLLKLLFEQGPATVILLGGPSEKPFETLLRASVPEKAQGRIIPAFDWKISEAVAAQAAADIYVGNDTAFLNISAAVGVAGLGLFGATEPLTHSPLIEAILPPDGRISRIDGMARIEPQLVLERINETLKKQRQLQRKA